MRWARPFDDRGLADAGVADEDRVVLGLARQDLDDPADLRIPADDRVELPGAGVGHEIAAVLLQGLVGHLGHRRGHPLVAPHRRERLEEPLPGQALLVQPPAGCGLAALVEEGDDEVLHGDVVVLEPLRLALGRVEQAGQPLGHEHLARGCAGAGDAGPPTEVGLDVGPQPVGIGARLAQQPGHEPVGLLEQGQQQVLAVHLGVAGPDGDGLRLLQRLLRLLGQSLRVHDAPPVRRVVVRVATRSAASSSAMRSSRSTTTPIAA